LFDLIDGLSQASLFTQNFTSPQFSDHGLVAIRLTNDQQVDLVEAAVQIPDAVIGFGSFQSRISSGSAARSHQSQSLPASR